MDPWYVSGRPPGSRARGPVGQYIRSRPEGAQGVLTSGALLHSRSHFSALTLLCAHPFCTHTHTSLHTLSALTLRRSPLNYTWPIVRLIVDSLYVSCWFYVVLLGWRLARARGQNAQKINLFVRIDLLKVFSSFLHPFFMIFEGFSILFPSLFRDLLLYVFLYMFSHFSDFPFLGEPSPTRILLEDSYGFRTFAFFEK